MKIFQLVPLFAAACLASPLLFSRAPILPSQDPFYKQPANIASYKPGQVINSRDVPPTLGGFTGLTSEPIKRFVQLLYRTTDTLNNPVAAVASILIPANANPNQLLAYQTAYDSANNNCATSYSLQTGANTSAIADVVSISVALNKGWYIVTSDFEGLLAQFTVGPMAGYATLDSVRAAFNYASKIGLSPNARYAMWGYSGGALASEWAAELQPSYAPELHFQGAALGGLIPNITSVLVSINKSLFAGLAFSGISGFNKSLPSAHQLYESLIVPSKRAEFESIAAGCLTQTIVNGFGKDLFSYFTDGQAVFQTQLYRDSIQQAGQAGTHGVPTMPIFAYKADGDEISPIVDSDLLVSKLCSRGALIEYQRNSFGEHFTDLITGIVPAFVWLSDRLDGKPVANSACVVEQVYIDRVGPGAPAAFTTAIISALQALLGSPLPLGPINGTKSN